MHLRAAERIRVFYRPVDAGIELGLATGQGSQPTLAPRPVAGRQVEQHLTQAEAIEALADVGCPMIVGKQELDGLEAGLGRRLEAIEEGQFLEQHAEVGGELGHLSDPVFPAT
jgi:hypothetical protein